MNDELLPDDPVESGTEPINDPQQAFQELRAHVGTGEKLRVVTQCCSHERLNGYLLGSSPELGLMHCFHDFMPGGYTVFRLADVTSIRSNEYERLWDRMLTAEGCLGGLQLQIEIDLKSVGSAIASIDAAFRSMIVEAEIPDADDAAFYIGQVESLNETELRFNHFDALGQWEPEPDVISLDEIAFIQFETPYIKTFVKYLDHPDPAGKSQQR